MFCIVCCLRLGSDAFETCWTAGRGDEAMENSYGLLDLTVYRRQEAWEDSPTGRSQWPKDQHKKRGDEHE